MDTVSEQLVVRLAPEICNGDQQPLQRIEMALERPTEEGDMVVRLRTNLAPEAMDACTTSAAAIAAQPTTMTSATAKPRAMSPRRVYQPAVVLTEQWSLIRLNAGGRAVPAENPERSPLRCPQPGMRSPMNEQQEPA